MTFNILDNSCRGTVRRDLLWKEPVKKVNTHRCVTLCILEQKVSSDTFWSHLVKIKTWWSNKVNTVYLSVNCSWKAKTRTSCKSFKRLNQQDKLSVGMHYHSTCTDPWSMYYSLMYVYVFDLVLKKKTNLVTIFTVLTQLQIY